MFERFKAAVGYVPVKGRQGFTGFINDEIARGFNGRREWKYIPPVTRGFNRGVPGAIFPFGPIGVGRTNLQGSVPLNGVAVGAQITTTGTLVTTGALSAGQYQFDVAFSGGPGFTALDIAFQIVDQLNNVQSSIRFNFQAIDIWRRFNLPISAGQSLRVQRLTTDSSPMSCSLSWTYLSPYRSNDPLSLASRRVQTTEPTTLGPTSGFSAAGPSYEPQVTSYEPGGGGDAGGGSGDGGE